MLGHANQAADAARIEGSFAGEDLDRNVTFELRIVRSIHFTHPADAEQRQKLIVTNSPAGPGRRCGVPCCGELVRDFLQRGFLQKTSAFGPSASSSSRLRRRSRSLPQASRRNAARSASSNSRAWLYRLSI